MGDRELLELAAEAAGMDAYWDQPRGSRYGCIRVRSEGNKLGYVWNPLADDGDALRLAVKLELAPSIFASPGLTICTATNRPMSEVNVEQEHDDGPYAATRRAIVRAAASIAKATGSDK